MVRTSSGVARITVTIDPIDLDLLDRLARAEGVNRSQELRSILEGIRPMLIATVDAFEAALRQRDAFDEKAAQMAVQGLQVLLPEVEALQRAYIGAMARIEGAEAAEGAQLENAPASNTGATNS